MRGAGFLQSEVVLVETLRDWYLSHLENNDDGSGLIAPSQFAMLP